MSHLHPLLQGACAGGIAGVLVLGLLGRLATALVAVSLSRPANLSLRGLAEVAIVGAVIGAVGGLLLPFLRRSRQLPRRVPGLLVGAVVAVGSAVLGVGFGRLQLSVTEPTPVTLAVVALVCLGYGWAADALLDRFMSGRSSRNTSG